MSEFDHPSQRDVDPLGAPQILPRERENELLRAIHMKNEAFPFLNLRNIIRLAAAEGFEKGFASRVDTTEVLLDIKLAVAKAAFGICSLSEKELFERLERLCLDAFVRGVDFEREKPAKTMGGTHDNAG